MVTHTVNSRVAEDGTVTVPVDRGDAGTDVVVTVAPLSTEAFPAPGSQVQLPLEVWLEKFLQLEGSVPNLIQPEEPLLDPIMDFD